MLDEKIWLQLSEEEKFTELQTYLDQIISIDEGQHEFSKSHMQGRLPEIKKELYTKIFKIIELENVT
jgi:hypothetical protein